MRTLLLLAAAGAVLCSAVGCSMLSEPVVPAATIAERHQTSLPHFSQTDRQCGPAALAMVLAGLGEQIDPADLESLLFTPEREGTLPSDIISGARRSGKLAYQLDGQIESLLVEIAAGNPPIVLLNLGLSWYPVYHYVVATGYDLAAQEIYYTSGRDVSETVSLFTFNSMWRRAGSTAVVIVAPGTVPTTATPVSYMQAVAALEQLHQIGAARSAYRAAHLRWPLDYRFPFLLGNTYLQEGAYARAIFWYEIALRQEQDSRILNNLAWSLYKSGDQKAAMIAINTALRIDQDVCGSTCEETRRDIQAGRR